VPNTYTGPSPAPRLPARAQNTPLCTADGSSGQITITAPNGSYASGSPGQQRSPTVVTSEPYVRAERRIGASTETQIEVSANTRIICSDALVCSGCHSRSWATAYPCRRTTHARWTQRRAASRIRPARFAPLRRPGPTAPPGRFPGRGHRDPRPRNQQSTAAAAAHRAANLRILTPRKTTARPYLSRWPGIVSPGPDFPDRPAGGSVIFRGRRSVTHGG